MCPFQKRVCKVISFSNSKLESLPLSPSPRPPDIFRSSLLAFFFSFTAPSLSTFLSSSFFLYFIRSFLLSIFAVFRISLLLSLFCSFCSFFLSHHLSPLPPPFGYLYPLPVFLSFFLGLFFSPIFTLFMPPFLIAHHLCPHPCFFPSIFPSILPNLPSSLASFLPSLCLSCR